MKQYVKYQTLLIPGKLRSEIKIIIDSEKRNEYASSFEGNNFLSLTVMPIISLSIIRPAETTESGVRIRAPFNPNDNLGMTKYTLPIFLDNVKSIKEDMKIPDLYSYHGDRLEINESKAESIRKVFIIGNITVELSAVVFETEDEKRIEGIKFKFNNEQSSVILTLNELESLVYVLDHLNIDSTVLLMYLNLINRPDSYNSNTQNIDINSKTF